MEEIMGDQKSTGRVYGISFISPSERKEIKYPQIVFSIPSEHAEKADRLLTKYNLNSQSEAHKAEFLSFYSEFVFTNSSFGFASCGTREETNGGVLYKINISGHESVNDVVLTVSALGEMLCILSDKFPMDSAQFPLLTLGVYGYENGYSVYGQVNPDFGCWLAHYGEKASTSSAFGLEPLPVSVCMAMQTVWTAVVPDDLKEYSNDCHAGINSSGRFSLSCFGDACDVSIYPRPSEVVNSGRSVEFGCHNVDAPWQVVTLVAGLAALHDVAAQELG